MQFVITDGLNEQLAVHIATDDGLLSFEGNDFVADNGDIDIGFGSFAQSCFLVGGVDLGSVQLAVVIGIGSGVRIKEDGSDASIVECGKDSTKGGIDSYSLAYVPIEKFSAYDFPDGDIEGKIILGQKVFIGDCDNISRVHGRMGFVDEIEEGVYF